MAGLRPGNLTIFRVVYETNPADPLTLAGTTVLLVAVVLVACLVPSRRAARVQPAVVLRGK